MKKTGELTRSRVSHGHLREVSEVVRLHLEVEDLALGAARPRDQELVQEALQRIQRPHLTPNPKWACKGSDGGG